MKSIASAPGKIILFGEHFVVYGSKSILASIDRRVTVTTTLLDEKKIKIKSNIGKLEIPFSRSYRTLKNPFVPFVFLAQKICKENNHEGGLKIDINSQIPPGVGLGSSSACCVAAAASITGVFNKISREKILDLAIEAEKKIFKNTSGADSTVITYGGILRYAKGSKFKRIKSPKNLSLIITNSKVIHSTPKVVLRVKDFRKKNFKFFTTLQKVQTSVINLAEKFLKNKNLPELGKVMSLNQGLLEQIGISNKQLRNIIKISNQTTFGSKITGAGDGGCIISLVNNANKNRTLKNLRKNNYDCFSVKIDSLGVNTF